ncbi:hypothetical protein JTB14_036615 [Gonioctena quinquepunctata]|nr:hypothetical protein JTB14_036615 [Gonioctena quinquepunctata]
MLEKKNAMGTGGGEYKAPGISDVSKKIHELGAQTIEGGTNEVDCDTVEDEPQAACSNQPAEPSSPQPLEVENVQELLDLENIVIEYHEESDEEHSKVPENNWATYTPASLKEPIHPALNISKTPDKSLPFGLAKQMSNVQSLEPSTSISEETSESAGDISNLYL